LKVTLNRKTKTKSTDIWVLYCTVSSLVSCTWKLCCTVRWVD